MDEMKAAIEASLLKFWADRSISVEESDSVEDFIDELDSLTAVDVLIDIEKITGIDIPEGSVIRRGGYDSKEQFVKHLTDRVMKYVQEQRK